MGNGDDDTFDRNLACPFGSKGYAKEELRAEIAAMIVGALPSLVPVGLLALAYNANSPAKVTQRWNRDRILRQNERGAAWTWRYWWLARAVLFACWFSYFSFCFICHGVFA